ncbi:hypothetical protein SISSUDRAFT_1065219 [Sistotremastrum suecicum HHB10207 ss-3]|uniref:Uncharacterized protein n=1 Tax=Sistotremastrum suecicum HHB10207 ss-3 TaxID=1314776 RepID=A0A165ZRZ2_9AGAM|nr:hypothetical protein SISSUDRAFT_1065219 [Sistotremastrum suecicum HHB10207 ss-3]
MDSFPKSVSQQVLRDMLFAQEQDPCEGSNNSVVTSSSKLRCRVLQKETPAQSFNASVAALTSRRNYVIYCAENDANMVHFLQSALEYYDPFFGLWLPLPRNGVRFQNSSTALFRKSAEDFEIPQEIARARREAVMGLLEHLERPVVSPSIKIEDDASVGTRIGQKRKRTPEKSVYKDKPLVPVAERWELARENQVNPPSQEQEITEMPPKAKQRGKNTMPPTSTQGGLAGDPFNRQRQGHENKTGRSAPKKSTGVTESKTNNLAQSRIPVPVSEPPNLHFESTLTSLNTLNSLPPVQDSGNEETRSNSSEGSQDHREDNDEEEGEKDGLSEDGDERELLGSSDGEDGNVHSGEELMDELDVPGEDIPSNKDKASGAEVNIGVTDGVKKRRGGAPGTKERDAYLAFKDMIASQVVTFSQEYGRTEAMIKQQLGIGGRQPNAVSNSFNIYKKLLSLTHEIDDFKGPAWNQEAKRRYEAQKIKHKGNWEAWKTNMIESYEAQLAGFIGEMHLDGTAGPVTKQIKAAVDKFTSHLFNKTGAHMITEIHTTNDGLDDPEIHMSVGNSDLTKHLLEAREGEFRTRVRDTSHWLRAGQEVAENPENDLRDKLRLILFECRRLKSGLEAVKDRNKRVAGKGFIAQIEYLDRKCSKFPWRDWATFAWQNKMRIISWPVGWPPLDQQFPLNAGGGHIFTALYNSWELASRAIGPETLSNLDYPVIQLWTAEEQARPHVDLANIPVLSATNGQNILHVRDSAKYLQTYEPASVHARRAQTASDSAEEQKEQHNINENIDPALLLPTLHRMKTEDEATPIMAQTGIGKRKAPASPENPPQKKPKILKQTILSSRVGESHHKPEKKGSAVQLQKPESKPQEVIVISSSPPTSSLPDQRSSSPLVAPSGLGYESTPKKPVTNRPPTPQALHLNKTVIPHKPAVDTSSSDEDEEDETENMHFNLTQLVVEQMRGVVEPLVIATVKEATKKAKQAKRPALKMKTLMEEQESEQEIGVAGPGPSTKKHQKATKGHRKTNM